MNINHRIEKAILVALIENLSAAGFKPAAVFIQGEGCYLLGDGKEYYKHAPNSVRGYLSATAVASLIFEVWDVAQPTIHFTEQNSTLWGSRGVMVVVGNGVDFISDWHSGDKAFNAIVETVADAAHEGAFTLFVAPVDIQDALTKAGA